MRVRDRGLLLLALTFLIGFAACKKKERVDTPSGQSSSPTSAGAGFGGGSGSGGDDGGSGGDAPTTSSTSSAASTGAGSGSLDEACAAFCGIDAACEAGCLVNCASAVPAGCEDAYAAYYACLAADPDGLVCQGNGYTIPAGKCPAEAAGLDCP